MRVLQGDAGVQPVPGGCLGWRDPVIAQLRIKGSPSESHTAPNPLPCAAMVCCQCTAAIRLQDILCRQPMGTHQLAPHCLADDRAHALCFTACIKSCFSAVRPECSSADIAPWRPHTAVSLRQATVQVYVHQHSDLSEVFTDEMVVTVSAV